MAIIRVAAALVKLGLGLGATALRLRHDRNVAVRAFRRALHETGLPKGVARELSEAYPQTELGNFMQKKGEPGKFLAADEHEIWLEC